MQESQRIAIAFTVNDSYAQHCCVAMASALENNKSEFLDIYIFTDYFSDRNRQLFEQTVRRYGDGNRLSFIIVEDSALKKLRLNISYITHHTYYRFLLPELLPELDRILYLDSDLVVNGPLRPLWETSLDGYYCAGVKDSWIEQISYKYRLGMSQAELYINAGVILMNLEQMRKDQAADQLLQTATQKGTQFEYQDQDVINTTFRGGKIKELPGIYNYTATDDKFHTVKRSGHHPLQRGRQTMVHRTQMPQHHGIPLFCIPAAHALQKIPLGVRPKPNSAHIKESGRHRRIPQQSQGCP